MSAAPALKGSDLRYLADVGPDGLHVGSAYLKASARRLLDGGYLTVQEEGDIGGAVLHLTEAGQEALRDWQNEQDGKDAAMRALTAGLGKVGVAQQQQTLNDIADYLSSQGVEPSVVAHVRTWLVEQR